MNTGAAVKKYIELRDYLERRGKEYEVEIAPYRAAMETIENAIAAEFVALGDVQNIKTEYGTAMRVKWTAVKMADRPTFMGFIADDFWKRSSFLTSAVTKTEVQDWIESHGAPPPGLDFSQGYKINIRRAS